MACTRSSSHASGFRGLKGLPHVYVRTPCQMQVRPRVLFQPAASSSSLDVRRTSNSYWPRGRLKVSCRVKAERVLLRVKENVSAPALRRVPGVKATDSPDPDGAQPSTLTVSRLSYTSTMASPFTQT